VALDPERLALPHLDARLAAGKAPDVLIYSRSDTFDMTIPLFDVKGREVFIASSLQKIQEYKCVMIEGGARMFEATKGLVDLYLAFIAPKFAKSGGFGDVRADFRFLNQQKVGDDIMAWMILEDGKNAK